ncbi:MAG: aminotransferase class V-fold PLP-dependent enzyme [Candidatus Marinimicrobia bacterium]|nr:aminotransferase class V-fold PLP-dependent enzyme [Candidatus Neomarinimicrobiota bacterium]
MIYNNIDLKELFPLKRDLTFLNHGSFGSCPSPIFDEFQRFQRLLESQPIAFLDEHISQNILTAQQALSTFINCDADDIVFFTNPTTAINEVMRSIPLIDGDEVLSSTHEYGALDKAWDFICKKRGATHVKADIPNPIPSKAAFIDAFVSAITSRTKVIFISHITSSTGLIFPIEEIIKIAQQKNIMTIVDGAHVPGHIPLDLTNLGADIYTGTCHKWLLCPKGTSFLFVKKELQHQIEPLIVSWGYENPEFSRTPFQNNHLWQGTRDISPFLTIPKAIEFRDAYHWNDVSAVSKEMILDFRKELVSTFETVPLFEDDASQWLGQMYSFSIPNHIHDCLQIKSQLIHDHNIEIPVFVWAHKLYLRISINGYNSEDDLHRLLAVLPKIISN